jgi:hypothetical protein
MGMLKRMKDMRDMVSAAPGMVAQAQQLGAQAQQMAAAQQAAMLAQTGAVAPGAAPAGADFEPIAGVSLEQFTAVSKGVAAFGYDQSKLVEVAASHGISASAWATAHAGWNERIHQNRAVAQRFNQIYRGI